MHYTVNLKQFGEKVWSCKLLFVQLADLIQKIPECLMNMNEFMKYGWKIMGGHVTYLFTCKMRNSIHDSVTTSIHVDLIPRRS